METQIIPEELCDPSLINCVRMLLKDDSVFCEIFAQAYENRNSNNLFFCIPPEFSITGKQIDLIAARSHLLKETPYQPGAWNPYPEVVPPRLNTEPNINGKTQECDYWLVKLNNGAYRTGKFTKDKNWIQFDGRIVAFREFSPRPAQAVLDNQTEATSEGWNAYPKFKPKEESVYEVILEGGLQRSAGWKNGTWTFWADLVQAFKKINE